MRQYREWKVGDTCYWGKLKGMVVRIDLLLVCLVVLN